MTDTSELVDVARQWQSARNAIVKSPEGIVGLVVPQTESVQQAFVQTHNRYSARLIQLLDLRDPILYEAFMELVINGRTIVNQEHVVRGT